MKPFYRYIRPLKFTEAKTELEVLPRGGICLRFETAEDSNLYFTYSRCYDDELFSKSVAKAVADTRAKNQAETLGSARPKIPFNQDTIALVQDILDACDNWALSVSEADGFFRDNAIIKYEYLELQSFRSALENLVQENVKQEIRARKWASGLQNLCIEQQYASAMVPKLYI